MKIEIKGKKYELNVQGAIKSNLLVPEKRITGFKVGDVFVSPKHAQVIVVNPVWGIGRTKKIYGFVGCRANFFAYSNDCDLLTHDEVIDYLNKNDLKYVGNVSQAALYEALSEECGDNFTF